MERRQAIFVIKNGYITYWDYNNGTPRLTSYNGERQIPYDASTFWKKWTDEEYFDQKNDILDAIFLVDANSYLSTFPQWVWHRKEQTRFTPKALEQIAECDEFCNKRIRIFIAGFPYEFGDKDNKEVTLQLFFKPSFSVPIPRIQLLVGKDHLFLRGDNANGAFVWDICKRLPYQQGHLQDTVKQLIQDFFDGYNLPNENGLSVLLYENTDPGLSTIARRALGNYCDSSTPINRILINLIRYLDTKKELHINQYGVNFDGVNYIMSNNSQILEREFSLLGYCLKDEDILA